MAKAGNYFGCGVALPKCAYDCTVAWILGCPQKCRFWHFDSSTLTIYKVGLKTVGRMVLLRLVVSRT